MSFTGAIKQKSDATYLVTLDTTRGTAWFYLKVEKSQSPDVFKSHEAAQH
jgi:hypothetical protein